MENINLTDVLIILCKRWYYIFISLVIVFIISCIYTFFIVTPIYESSFTVYVGKSNDQSQQASQIYSELQANQQLVLDYKELITKEVVTNEVINQLKAQNSLKDKSLTPVQLADKLNIVSKNQTRFLQVSVTDQDPKQAQILASKLSEVFLQKAKDIIKVENITKVDNAKLPTKPIKPNYKTNLLISLFLGVIIGMGIVFLREYLDKTVKTPEDVEKIIGLPVIGAIPEFKR